MSACCVARTEAGVQTLSLSGSVLEEGGVDKETEVLGYLSGAWDEMVPLSAPTPESLGQCPHPREEAPKAGQVAQPCLGAA